MTLHSHRASFYIKLVWTMTWRSIILFQEETERFKAHFHSGKFSAKRKFCGMWLAGTNFPSEKRFEFENFRKIFCPWKFFFSANGPIQFRLENFTAFSEDSHYFFTYCTGVEKIGEHCSQEMFNSCREFIWMKICYWKCEGNLNTHVNIIPWIGQLEHHMFMHMQI